MSHCQTQSFIFGNRHLYLCAEHRNKSLSPLVCFGWCVGAVAACCLAADCAFSLESTVHAVGIIC